MKYKYSVAHKAELHKFEDEDKARLMVKIKSFYRQHNIIFTDETISRGIDRQSQLYQSPKTLGLAAVASGAMAMVKSVAGVSVSSEEVIRRSNICSSCPLISKIGGCSSCGAAGKIANWANKIRAGKGLQIPIPSEVRHSYCDFCKCALSLMVTTKITDFHTESQQTNLTRPDNCWLKTTSTNYSNA